MSQQGISLSLITATYHDTEGLRKTLLSLQPLRDSNILWEQIIIDSSPSETKEVLKEFSGWRFQHIQSEPRGVYSALNEGISKASGELVMFLHSGDRLMSIGALESFLGLFQGEPNLDMVCGGGHGFLSGVYQYTKYPKTTFKASILGANGLVHQAVLYRRSVFRRVGSFNQQYKIAADLEHFLRCYLAGLRVLCQRKVLIIFEMGGLSDVQINLSLVESKMIKDKVWRETPFRFAIRYEVSALASRFKLEVRLFLFNSGLAKTLRPLWLKWKGLTL